MVLDIQRKVTVVAYHNYAKEIVQQVHWTNEIAVEEHEHMVIKLTLDSDSSSDTDTVFGPRAYEISLH